MAAEALESAAAEMGVEIFVETQGSAGISAIDDNTIATADAAIFAADIGVRGRDRFEHLPIYEIGVKVAINQPAGVISEAIERAKARQISISANASDNDKTESQPEERTSKKSKSLTTVRQWLMTGMSYAIPAIAVGGSLTTVARWFTPSLSPVVVRADSKVNFQLLLNSQELLRNHHFPGALYLIGLLAMALAIPILSGFTAFAIADRPALIPGLIGGLSASYLGGGYLGGICVGVIAGLVVRYIGKIKFPEALRSVVPTTITPVLSTVITTLASTYLISPPSRAINHHLIMALNGLNTTELGLIGAIIGAMMAADLGGPINKIAYSIGILFLLSGNYLLMAAVIASGVVPPIGLSLAAIVAPGRFTVDERKNAPLSAIIGASLVSERAIPFTKSGYRREMVIASIVGAAISGATSMALKVTSPMPHGGFFVFYLFGHPGYFALAVAVGSTITLLLAVLLRSPHQKNIEPSQS